MQNVNLPAIAERFRFEGSLLNGAPHGRGHIHDTWELRLGDSEANAKRYILQRINRTVFREPERLMENLSLVTAHLTEKARSAGGDPSRETLTLEEAHAVEDFANSIVFENRAIRTYFRSEDEIASIPLRRTPKKKGRIRIVEIDGFDYTPCGGTHCHHTGEIGLIKTGRWEKIRGRIRVQFLCGSRALSEYRWKSETVEALADRFSARGEDILSLVTKQEDEMKELKRKVTEVTARILHVEAHELLSKASLKGEVKVVKGIFQNRPSEDLKTLATMITESERSIALLGNCDEKGQFVFSCSKGLPYRMNDLVKEACAIIGGRGGGSPTLAFGGGPEPDTIEEAVDHIFQHIMKG